MSTPTTTAINAQLLGNFPSAIAAALATLSSQALADLTQLMTGGGNVGGNPAWKARMVATQLPAYAGTGTGVLTASATGVIGAMDGVTPALNDVILVPAGVTNVTAADSGPWQITTLGAVGVKYVLTRPSWYAHGATYQYGQTIEVGPEGTLFANTQWKGMTKGSVIDTTDAQWFPGRVNTQITLANGVFALTTIPLFSATKTTVLPTYAGSGTPNAATLTYQAGAVTPGAIGTASVTIGSYKAAMATQATDTSVLNVLVCNW